MMKLFTIKKRFGGLHIIDHHHLNNGGHNEYKIFRFQVGHKTKRIMFCVIEFDIYGKCETNQFTEDEFRNKFGEYSNKIIERLPTKPN